MPAPHDPNLAQRRSALLVAVVTSFLTPFMGSAVNIALPSIAREFGLSAVMTNWVATAYLLAAATFLVPFGRAADIYGRKRIFATGVIIYTLASMLLAAAQSSTILIAFRLVQGVGGSMIFGTGIAILTSVYPASQRGRVLGINVAAVYLGLAAGPSLGGLLTGAFGWRSIFFLNVPIGFLILSLIFWKLKGEWAESKGEKFDYAGAVLYGLAFCLLMYGLSKLPHRSGLILSGAGLLVAIVFVLWENRATHPVLHVSLFHENHAFLLSNLAALANYAATTAGGFLLSLYLQNVKGMEPKQAGIFLVWQPLIMSACAPFAGRISDRVEPRIVATAGMTLTAASLFMFCFIDAHSSYRYLAIALVVLGAGIGLFSSPNTNAIMSSVPKKHFGIASGMVGTMRLSGQMISMGITMLLFALYMGHQKMEAAATAPFLRSTRLSFQIFFVLCLLGIVASMARGKIRE